MINCIMFACRNIRDELLAAVLEAGVKFPVLFIPRELHLIPDKLRVYLQDMIDNIENTDYILLPMGMCGNGTVGLMSSTASIVLPKCGDCIDMLLSEEGVKTERSVCSYFLTAGWLGDDNSIDVEYKRTIEKYDAETASMIIEMLYKNYKHFCFIDTGTYDIDAVKEKIKPLTEITKMDVIEVKGRYNILRKMAALEFDSDFVIVPPGETVCEKHFRLTET